ncbi:MAG: hypothetical protein HYT65_03255 [Candidatus Yanofskybacteria bacterium]|nr:hypothetical protein [Candidatus Yanofskybacteria bacterium]
MKFSAEKPKFAEGVIEFDEITCCALGRAFLENKETVQQLKEVVGSDVLRKMAEDMSPITKNTAFAPTADEKIAYSQIAKKELEQLEGGDSPNFNCKHPPAQHIAALRSIIKEIQPRLN